MKAALYHDFRKPLVIDTVADPVPAAGGVIIEVKSTGLCLSDWHGWMGHDPDIRLPHVPGHEMSGVIAEVGNQVSIWKRGDRVTLPFVCGCGNCTYCKEGNPQVCNHQFQPGFTDWGSFAPFVSIKYAQHNLVKIPEYLSFQSASILGCRFGTSYRAIVDQGKVQPGQWIAVHGCGGIGLSAVMVAKALDARVIAIDLKESGLKLASDLGAGYTLDASDPGIAEHIKDITDGGVHLSLDAVGRMVIVKNSLDCLRKGGRHLQVGLMNPEERNIPIPFDLIVARELKILGSHGIQASRYGSLFALMESGKLDPGRLITQTISLKESLKALVQLNSKGAPGITVIDNFKA